MSEAKYRGQAAVDFVRTLKRPVEQNGSGQLIET
jgi:hypothetical protein